MARQKKARKRQKIAREVSSPNRVEKALRENRTQQALELARRYHKQELSDESRELLKRACLARGQDLLERGYQRDAGEVFANVLDLDNSPAFAAKVALGLARCGHIAKALELRDQFDDPETQTQIIEIAADEAVRLSTKSRTHVGGELEGEFDAIIQAFGYNEKGDEDRVREKLALIGLKSPFLEWKVLLRGLLAYYHRDDARALENWRRLNPERLPFRLVSPVRFAIDADFAQNQPPQSQIALQKQHDRLFQVALPQQLRTLQAALGKGQNFSRAIRQAGQVLPKLRQQAPELVSRLAACFYWSLVRDGTPGEIDQCLRTFGAPPEDPTGSRLRALSAEFDDRFSDAHRHWQKFETSIVENPVWPDEQKDRVRALIWQRMGKNAARVPELPDIAPVGFLPPHITDRFKPLEPAADQCFRRSLELAPNQLDTHEELFDYFLQKDQFGNSVKAARNLLKHFPNHAPSLEKLGDLYLEKQKYTNARDCFQNALHANPLEQRLRERLATAHAYAARSFVDEGKFDEARSAYQTAIQIDERQDKFSYLCKWAACEFKAKKPERAEELLAQAEAEQGNRLAVVFSTLIELIRFKLNKLKKRFNDEFNSLLAEEPTAAPAVLLAETAAAMRAAGVEYHGQQTHEKKIQAYLKKAANVKYSEPQLRRICKALAILEKPTLQQEYIHLGQKQFGQNAIYYLMEAEFVLNKEGYYRDIRRAERLLKKARTLAESQPPSDEQKAMLNRIGELEEQVAPRGLFGGMFEDFFNQMPFSFYDDDDDEEDEDFYY